MVAEHLTGGTWLKSRGQKEDPQTMRRSISSFMSYFFLEGAVRRFINSHTLCHKTVGRCDTLGEQDPVMLISLLWFICFLQEEYAIFAAQELLSSASLCNGKCYAFVL